jgi:methionyl-tRNA formyltransferase
MRIVFMGTPDFAIPCLKSLLQARNEVVGVYCRPDKEVGRGRRLEASPVKRFAADRELPVFQPVSLRRAEAQAELADLAPDAVVVAAYGVLLPKGVLETPRLGCLNVHPSLLPRNRGPAPVVTTILEGDEVSGVTVMLLDEGMDTGPLLAQRQEAVRADDTAPGLTRRLFAQGAELLLDILPRWSAGAIEAIPQDEALATTTRRITKENGILDWSAGAEDLCRRVRGYEPWPGTYTFWQGKQLKVLAARPGKEQATAPIGTVVRAKEGAAVVTGEGLFIPDQVQLEGRRSATTREFLLGHPEFVGAKLPS